MMTKSKIINAATCKKNHFSHIFPCMALALCLGVLAALSGCGSVGSGDSASGAGSAALTVSGAVQTPGGTATYRAAARSAAQLANVTSSVPVSVYTTNAAGETLLVSGATDALGNFSIVLPAGVNLTDYSIIVKATFGANTLRALISSSSSITVSPASEAAVQIIEERLVLAGATKESISRDEMLTIWKEVVSATDNLDYSAATSVSQAVTLAKNTALADTDVTSAIATAINSVAPTYYALYTTSDYTSGRLASVKLDGSPGLGVTVNTTVAEIFADALIKTDDRYVYVINRLGSDSIQVLDSRSNFSLVANYTAGDSSNPYDIEVISSTKAYISRYGSTSILIVNPLTGAQQGTIDLSAFVDSDGKPEMTEMVEVNGKVYVLVQRLVSFSPSAPGLVAVIDTATDTLVDTDAATAGTQAVTLNCYNPQYMDYLAAAGKMYISCSGSYYDTTVPGGIDVLDPATYAVSNLMSKTTLGGAPGDIAVTSSTLGYIVVSGSDWVNRVWAFNPTTGALAGTAPVYTAGGYVPEIGIDPFGYLMISDTGFSNPGVVFINTTTNATAAGPISTGLPPQAVAYITVPSS
jgi:hypothetical protein